MRSLRNSYLRTRGEGIAEVGNSTSNDCLHEIYADLSSYMYMAVIARRGSYQRKGLEP